MDVDPFVELLIGGSYQAEADMNQDQVLNGLDVQPFVVAVLGTATRSVPEPGGLVLAMAALLLMGCWRARRCLHKGQNACSFSKPLMNANRRSWWCEIPAIRTVH
jgi:hypothetical protein